MRTCKKCGKEGYHPEILPLRLSGGYHAELCVACQNDAEEHLRPELEHMAGLEACLSAAVMTGDKVTATDYAERMNKEKIRLYGISKKWAEGEPK